jgi:NAD(P)-dependent dehydrogenase (short-subunit alcohol dehydrogenase family)
MRPKSSSRTAIVTGASQGIGLAIAQRLVEDGLNVVGCARTAGAASAALERLGDAASGVDADVRDSAAVDRVVAGAVDRFGGVDVLVNNAGVYQRKNALEVEPDEFEEIMQINVIGSFLCAKAAAKAMIATDARARGGGRIINIASVAGMFSESESVAYNASKAAVISITRTLAFDLAPHGIASMCVAPGWVDTGIDPVLETLGPEQLRRLNPQGRAGTPAEVAHAVSGFCDPRAQFMNGAVVTVDGGQMAAAPDPV